MKKINNFEEISNNDLLYIYGGKDDLARIGGLFAIGEMIYNLGEATGKAAYFITHPQK